MSGQGAMIGAAAGGIYGLATGKDPVKSAMIGAAVGSGGGALMGAGATGAGAASTAGATQAAGIAANPALSMGAANTAAGSAMAAPAASSSLLSSFTGGLQSANTFANQNPVATNIGLQAAGSLLTPTPPTPMGAPPNLMRGQQFQMEQPMYGMAPQQPISLI